MRSRTLLYAELSLSSRGRFRLFFFVFFLILPLVSVLVSRSWSIIRMNWTFNRVLTYRRSFIFLCQSIIILKKCKCLLLHNRLGLLIYTMKWKLELDLKVALAMNTPDFLKVAFLLIGPVTLIALFDLRIHFLLLLLASPFPTASFNTTSTDIFSSQTHQQSFNTRRPRARRRRTPARQANTIMRMK